ncbi:glycosyl transferase family 1 [Sphingomonas turrisvirgatae]|uniref:Glycosyl transferase family 1 n=1 Tax=Sphingomonas turrisvirgatae TaxID=1888892 RepID=A0A1E3M2W7_9SPHN|nr:glycosyl transferase family 1 [Sphingomonas turrisvirgatae]ODP39410.1 glycosyl transferase family 1 [Sphingomonas turrisvirgatae]
MIRSLRLFLALLAIPVSSAPAIAQVAARAPAPAAPTTAAPRTILFVGNSFTQGAHSAVRNYRAGSVTDLTGRGYGGVPALFKLFAEQAGLSYAVSSVTQGGSTLGLHLAERRPLWDRRWDVVVLQDFSTFSRERPGDPASHVRDAGAIAALLKRANPRARIELLATWSRADLIYRPGSRWTGTSIDRMAIDLRRGNDAARRASRDIDGVIPVGQAWNRAFATRVADPNPYDGIAFGQLNLWSYDHYHASIAGYYLEALVVFGKVTGVDPRRLGERERAADDLGLSGPQAKALQQVAWETLSAEWP